MALLPDQVQHMRLHPRVPSLAQRTGHPPNRREGQAIPPHLIQDPPRRSDLRKLQQDLRISQSTLIPTHLQLYPQPQEDHQHGELQHGELQLKLH